MTLIREIETGIAAVALRWLAPVFDQRFCRPAEHVDEAGRDSESGSIDLTAAVLARPIAVIRAPAIARSAVRGA
jgi:hypothetical protein